MYVIISTKIPAIIHTIAICFNVRRFRTWDGVKVQICSGRRQSDVSSSLQVRYLFIHSFFLFIFCFMEILHFTFYIFSVDSLVCCKCSILSFLYHVFLQSCFYIFMCSLWQRTFAAIDGP